MSEVTPLRLPESLPFPVKVSSIHIHKGDRITKHQQILTYSYWEYQDAPEVEQSPFDGERQFKPKQKVRVDLIGTFESPIDGIVNDILVAKGEEVLSSDQEIVKILEPCTHSIQYGGLCALCGKALDEEADYSGYKYEDRAPISMSHGTSDLKISKNEAEKVEERWTKSLIAEKKLILVVDLDQTVIHATVDPTIKEWMKDENNPNYPSLKDVKTFILEEEITLPPNHTGPKPPPFGREYYVKLRPGLEDFLQVVSEKYELHIYTMGTRAYAKSIANCIDPDGKYFADRILSRDESGSLTQKSLERLFPTDTSMVVIIDDRGDVWNWSEHLIKVVPFDFFVGIGDINSNFLPRQRSLLGPSKRRDSIARLEEQLLEASDSKDPSKEKEELDRKIQELRNEAKIRTDEEVILSDEQNAELIAARSNEREASLEAQTEERPLAKLQKDLNNLAKEKERLLYDDDDELVGLQKALIKVHEEFYTELTNSTKSPPNIKIILPRMKQVIFDGLCFVFSGLFPLGSDIYSESIVFWVKSFGAKVSNEVTMETTHIIAKNPYTYKARLGKSMLDDCKIVHPNWLFDCMSNWRRCDTKEFEVAFAEDRKLPEREVLKYKEKLNQKSHKNVTFTEDTAQGDDGSEMLLGGGLNWLNDDEDDEELEELLNEDDDDEDEGEDGVSNGKRGYDDDEEEEDDILGSKRVKTDGDGEEDDDEDDDDDDDDDFAAELMQEFDGED